jgi:uncharacterized membrane protein YebE (DUF533 family)
MTASPLNQVVPMGPNGIIPAYALTKPYQHAGETTAAVAIILGTLGIVGSVFLIPIAGLVFGIAGLCLSTISRRKARRRLALIGLAVASLAITSGLAALVWNMNHDKTVARDAQTGQTDSASQVLSFLKTPCYSFNLVDTYNVSNQKGSCTTTMYNNQTFATSTDVYKIVATDVGTINPDTFTALAKQAINTDVQTNLPDFTITNQGPSSFAGSLAYSVYADNKAQNTAVVETGVLHQTPNGENAFDILHAVNGPSTNLEDLEVDWQWK